MKPFIRAAGHILTCFVFMSVLFSCKNRGNSTTTMLDSTSADSMAMAGSHPASDLAANIKPIDTMRSTTYSGNMPNNMSGGDKRFVMDVVKGNTQEMQLLRAGEKQGNSMQLTSDAHKMLADHMVLDKELRDYAGQRNIALPMDTTADLSMINSAAGAFDKSWTAAMIKGHRDMIAKFSGAQTRVADPELMNLIAKALPTLHKHLDMTLKLQSGLK